MSSSRVLRWVTGGLEALLAIPIIGGSIIIGFAYIPLAIMFVLHIITLILSRQQGEAIYGSVLGIITSIVGIIPFLGWAMHVITAVLLIISAASDHSSNIITSNDKFD